MFEQMTQQQDHTEAMIELADNYAYLFGSPQGRKVLEDLKALLCVGVLKPIEMTSEERIYSDCRDNIWMYIQNMIHIRSTQIKETITTNQGENNA